MNAVFAPAPDVRIKRRLPNRGIPGPRLPTLIQSFLSPWQSMPRAKRYAHRYGDIFRTRVLVPRQRIDDTRWPFVAGDFVLVTSPELMHEVTEKTGPTFLAGEVRRFAGWFLGASSLLVVDGPEALREKRHLLSLFGPDHLAAQKRELSVFAQAFFARLKPNERVPLEPVLEDVICEGALRLLFRRLERTDVDTLRRAFMENIHSSAWSPLGLLFPSLVRDSGRSSPRGFQTAPAQFMRVIKSELGRRRDSRVAEDDLFAQLLQVEDGEDPASLARIHARVMTLMVGLDTAAVALAWCCLHLSSHPEMLALAQQAAREPASLPGGRRSYVEAACLEALRIHPPLPVFLRVATAPVTIGGHRLQPGTVVVGVIALTHRRADLFPEPDQFRPERFLDNAPLPSAFMPFGGGARRCLGYAFAVPLMTTVLTELLRAVDLQPMPSRKNPEHRRFVMMGPRGPLPVAVSRA
jgi:cytochrome P450